MKRQERIEKAGYKVVFCFSGKVFAKRNNGLTSIEGSSVTDLHRRIFGY